MNKKECLAAAIENGTVTDCIPVDRTYQVINLLRLQSLGTLITIGNNFVSKKIEKKGIIKVSSKFFSNEEISRLSVVASKVVLNIIRDYRVMGKETIETPNELRGIVKCNSLIYITSNEPIQAVSHVVDEAHGLLKCHYCDKEQDVNKVELC